MEVEGRLKEEYAKWGSKSEIISEMKSVNSSLIKREAVQGGVKAGQSLQAEWFSVLKGKWATWVMIMEECPNTCIFECVSNGAQGNEKCIKCVI